VRSLMPWFRMARFLPALLAATAATCCATAESAGLAAHAAARSVTRNAGGAPVTARRAAAQGGRLDSAGAWLSSGTSADRSAPAGAAEARLAATGLASRITVRRLSLPTSFASMVPGYNELATWSRVDTAVAPDGTI